MQSLFDGFSFHFFKCIFFHSLHSRFLFTSEVLGHFPKLKTRIITLLRFAEELIELPKNMSLELILYYGVFIFIQSHTILILKNLAKKHFIIEKFTKYTINYWRCMKMVRITSFKKNICVLLLFPFLFILFLNKSNYYKIINKNALYPSGLNYLESS